MARSPAGKPRTSSAQVDGAPAPAAPAPDPGTPDPGTQDESETRYRVLSAIKYGGKWRLVGDELTLPAEIALDLKGRVEEIG